MYSKMLLNLIDQNKDEELRNLAISAIMEMDIQNVVKYLSYIKNGEI